MQKIFALVDCNAFYCSCERLFRPDLLHRPIGVLSNNDGCFVSLTKDLKALGVEVGSPYFKFKDLCRWHQAAVFSANFSLYTNMSDRVMSTLTFCAPEIEVYSIDEAFLDLSGMAYDKLESYGHWIKKTVERQTGIPVSIGIASTKTLAKMANHLGKKEEKFKGVLALTDRQRCEDALAQTKIEDIWGIGRKTASKLRLLNIKTAKDFRDYKNDYRIQKIFTKVGRQIQDELRGIPCYTLETKVEKKKSIISSRTFGQPVYDLSSLRESVASYVSLACEKLRRQNSVCSKIEVYVRTNPFKEIEQYYGLSSSKFLSHTADTRRVIKYAWSVLDQLYKDGYEYKKALVQLSGICDQSETQTSLFEHNDDLQSQKLMAVMDAINQREGPQTIRSAACGLNNKSWRMRQENKSPRYVTGWSELPTVK